MDMQTVTILPPWAHYPLNQAVEFYKEQLNAALLEEDGPRAYYTIMRTMAERDLFFLLYEVLNRTDMAHQWTYERCREFQSNPNGNLDLWAREHYKSTIITFAGTIHEIIKDQEITCGIFSHTRPIAKQFLRQIMFEMESNKKLPLLWPGIFWEEPRRQSPKWSEDDGIVVKRNTNPKESTVEAWGLVDGQPTSKHFKLRVYDDIVTEASISTPEQIQKTTKGWELSSNLASKEGAARHAGTRYHLFDTYAEIIKRGAAQARVHAATDDGTETGVPVLMAPELLKKKRVEQGPYTFAAQMLLNPVADKVMGFREEWLQYAVVSRTDAKAQLNIYLICDPASEKRAKARKDPDYTSMWVIGASPAEKFYLLDGVRDRLNLGQRADHLIRLHRKWKPKGTGYEEYGIQADIEHIKYRMREQLYEFEIIPLGGSMAKADRIKRLIPVFEGGRVFLPNGLLYLDHTGVQIDLVKTFIQEEYLAFPVCAHDDQIDNLARILDPELGVIFPDPEREVEEKTFDYGGIEDAASEGRDWMIA